MKHLKILVLAIIIIAGLAGAAYLAGPVPPISGIPCGLKGPLAMHIHPHLDIFINGQIYAIPAGVGIVPQKCLYWIHTHDSTGVIHIESPVQKDFTLGEFFDIWGKAFSNTQIFDYQAGSVSPLAVYVNGQPAGGSYRDIVLRQHDEIAIVYGTPPAQIPSSYVFAPGL